MDLRKIMLHIYDNVSELTTEELIALISEILDIEEVSFALDELYERDVAKAMELGKNILEQCLGDKYLQAAIVDFFARRDKQYLVDYINRRLNKMDSYVYASVVEFLMYESDQPFGQSIPDSLLRLVSSKYQSYDDDEKNKAAEVYESFRNAYEQRL